MAVVDPQMRQGYDNGILARCPPFLQPTGNSADIAQVEDRPDLQLFVRTACGAAPSQRFHEFEGRPHADWELLLHVAEEFRNFFFVINLGASFAYALAAQSRRPHIIKIEAIVHGPVSVVLL